MNALGFNKEQHFSVGEAVEAGMERLCAAIEKPMN